jgi:hypothetical protein
LQVANRALGLAVYERLLLLDATGAVVGRSSVIPSGARDLARGRLEPIQARSLAPLGMTTLP